MIDSHHDEKSAKQSQSFAVASTAATHSQSLIPLAHHPSVALSGHVPTSDHCSIRITETPRSRPSPLLDVIPPIRSLIWQYMDNCSAVQYLNMCKQLRSLYHAFPLCKPVSVSRLIHIAEICRALRPSATLVLDADLCVCSLILLILCPFLILVVIPLALTQLCFPDRQHCCQQNKRLTRYMRIRHIPRVIRSADFCNGAALAFMQHAEELRVMDHNITPICEYKLPSSLRRLYLALPADRLLDTDWLPSHLTVLAIFGGARDVLQPGVLPQSLTTLILQRGGGVYGTVRSADNPFQPIAAGVLPSQLQCLVIHWHRSLADLALPASLTRLDLNDLPDLPFPANCLPVGLHCLRISTKPAFDPRHLIGALPPSLRVLQLRCWLTQPLTADLFTTIPQLEELDLGSCCSYPVEAGALVYLISLRVRDLQ